MAKWYLGELLLRTSYYLGKLLYGELLHGEMLYGEMLHGEMLYGEMLHGEILNGEFLHGEMVYGEMLLSLNFLSHGSFFCHHSLPTCLIFYAKFFSIFPITPFKRKLGREVVLKYTCLGLHKSYT